MTKVLIDRELVQGVQDALETAYSHISDSPEREKVYENWRDLRAALDAAQKEAT